MATADDTRARILAATRGLLAAGGPERVTMRAVAGRVGVSATALYRHFRDRDALLAEVVQEDARSIATYLFPALELADPRERLLATAAGYVRFAAGEPTLYAALMDPGARSGNAAESVARQREALLRFLRDRVREAAAPESDAEDLTLLLWCLLHGAATLPGGADVTRLVGTLFRLTARRVALARGEGSSQLTL
jgi:AcrR family transcriptional regulator